MSAEEDEANYRLALDAARSELAEVQARFIDAQARLFVLRHLSASLGAIVAVEEAKAAP